MPRRLPGALAALVLPLSVAAIAQAQAPQKRPIRVDDILRVRDVRDPQVSPDGKWVSYTLSTADTAKDKNDTDVWMTSWDGATSIRVTSTPEGEGKARWSPDNRYLSFVSSRLGAENGQLWLMDRAGGEAQKLTEFKGGVSDYEWSPDGKRIAFIVEDDPDTTASKDTSKTKTPKPIVIDRYTFKRDIVGYLGGKRERIYVYDVASKKADLLSSGPAFNEGQVAWSPDGKRIAFVSKRGQEDVDRTNNTDIWVADAKGGATVRRLTSHPGTDNAPAWSPDGRSIAYLQGGDPKFYAYDVGRLAVVQVDGCAAQGCAPRILTTELDRNVESPRWSRKDGQIYITVVDDRTQWIGRIAPAGGKVERLTTGNQVLSAMSDPTAEGRVAALLSTDDRPAEVAALEGNTVRRITKQNDGWIAEVQLGVREDFTSRSKDGTEVHSIVTKPANFRKGVKYPLLLRIHGGPDAQEDHSFQFEHHLFAAHGYVVLAVNYRGGAGRGEKYQTAIYGDWGNLEVVDLLGAVDGVVAAGIADPERLGIGGWSYGGILTNYAVATTTRFKGAVSGAGSSLQLSMYGVDQYTYQYETELGVPWKNPDAWIKVSYPFFHADRIRTPTLFLVGERDFNVPAVGSEQMYQALRSLGVPTGLIIYPGQFHGIAVPSYRKDRLERYLGWYEKYVKNAKGSDGARAGG